MPPEPPGPSVAPPPLRVEADGEVWTFDRPFTVGREACDVTLDEARVSRLVDQVVAARGRDPLRAACTWQVTAGAPSPAIEVTCTGSTQTVFRKVFLPGRVGVTATAGAALLEG